MRLVSSVFFVIVISQFAHADVIDLTIESGLSFEQSSGIQFIDVFATWNGSQSAPFGDGFSADFLLSRVGSGPAVAFSSEGPTSNDLTPTGRIGMPSSLGVTQLRITSALAFPVSDPSLAILNLNFLGSIQMPSTTTLVARLSVDTNTLAPGTFSIAAENPSFGTFTGFNVSNGGFSITAVPEPSSLLLTAGVAVGTAFAVSKTSSFT